MEKPTTLILYFFSYLFWEHVTFIAFCNKRDAGNQTKDLKKLKLATG